MSLRDILDAELVAAKETLAKAETWVKNVEGAIERHFGAGVADAERDFAVAQGDVAEVKHVLSATPQVVAGKGA